MVSSNASSNYEQVLGELGKDALNLWKGYYGPATKQAIEEKRSGISDADMKMEVVGLGLLAERLYRILEIPGNLNALLDMPTGIEGTWCNASHSRN